LNRKGQAVVEYAVVLTLILTIIGTVGWLARQTSQSATGGLQSQTFRRAPYTVSSSVGSSGQYVKDILLH